MGGCRSSGVVPDEDVQSQRHIHDDIPKPEFKKRQSGERAALVLRRSRQCFGAGVAFGAKMGLTLSM